jgi:hypothetical protein
MIAKRLAYMPKARNRAKVESIQDRGDENDSKVVNYTLDEERQLAGASLDQEATPTPASSSSTISKTASSMWLQSRMNQPGTSRGGTMSGKMTATSASIGKADTRYMTNTSLPYRLPPVAEAKAPAAQINTSSAAAALADRAKPGSQAAEAVDPASASASSPSSVEARVRASRTRDEFNSFMRSTRFAEKVTPSRLVRQCGRCQMLYSAGHSCESTEG